MLEIASAPKLVTISFRHSKATLIFAKDVPHLVAFSLHVFPDDHDLSSTVPDYWPSLIRRMLRVRILSVDLCMLKTLVRDDGNIRSDVFHDLKELHLNIGQCLAEPLLNTICLFLRLRPSIEKICLKIGDGYRWPRDQNPEDYQIFRKSSMEYHEFVGRKYETIRRKPSSKQLKLCTLAGLKIVKVVGFMGTRNEMKLVRFLLKSAINLESLYLFCCAQGPKDLLERTFENWGKRSSPDAHIMVAICLASEQKESIFCSKPTTVQMRQENCKSSCICSWHSGDKGFNPSREMKVYWIGKDDDGMPERITFEAEKSDRAN